MPRRGAWWRWAYRTTSRSGGNNRQQVCFPDAQRLLCLALLSDQAKQHQLEILGYCLMPNHIHTIVVPQAQTSLAHGFGRAHNACSRCFNQSRRRCRGHLWQNRFYAAPLDAWRRICPKPLGNQEFVSRVERMTGLSF